MDFYTKYGDIKITAATSSETPTGFPDLDIRPELNTVEIDDDPYNTYGLASKWMVLSSLSAHEKSQDAHAELFNRFMGELYDLYDKQGELRISAISDVYGNVVYANRKVVLNGDAEHPKYIVCSDSRDASFDALVERVRILEERLAATE